MSWVWSTVQNAAKQVGDLTREVVVEGGAEIRDLVKEAGSVVVPPTLNGADNKDSVHVEMRKQDEDLFDAVISDRSTMKPTIGEAHLNIGDEFGGAMNSNNQFFSESIQPAAHNDRLLSVGSGFDELAAGGGDDRVTVLESQLKAQQAEMENQMEEHGRHLAAIQQDYSAAISNERKMAEERLLVALDKEEKSSLNTILELESKLKEFNALKEQLLAEIEERKAKESHFENGMKILQNRILEVQASHNAVLEEKEKKIDDLQVKIDRILTENQEMKKKNKEEGGLEEENMRLKGEISLLQSEKEAVSTNLLQTESNLESQVVDLKSVLKGRSEEHDRVLDESKKQLELLAAENSKLTEQLNSLNIDRQELEVKHSAELHEHESRLQHALNELEQTKEKGENVFMVEDTHTDSVVDKSLMEKLSTENEGMVIAKGKMEKEIEQLKESLEGVRREMMGKEENSMTLIDEYKQKLLNLADIEKERGTLQKSVADLHTTVNQLSDQGDVFRNIVKAIVNEREVLYGLITTYTERGTCVMEDRDLHGSDELVQLLQTVELSQGFTQFNVVNVVSNALNVASSRLLDLEKQIDCVENEYSLFRSRTEEEKKANVLEMDRLIEEYKQERNVWQSGQGEVEVLRKELSEKNSEIEGLRNDTVQMPELRRQVAHLRGELRTQQLAGSSAISEVNQRTKEQLLLRETLGTQTREVERLRTHLAEIENTHFSEIEQLERDVTKYKNELNSVQDRLKSSTVQLSEKVDNLQSSLNHTESQLKERTEELRVCNTSLNNLQIALEEYQNDASSDTTLDLHRTQKKLVSMEKTVESTTKELESVKQLLNEKTASHEQYTDAVKLFKSAKQQVEKQQRDIVRLQRALQQSVSTLTAKDEDSVDRRVIVKLLTTYLEPGGGDSRAIVERRKCDSLSILAGILGVSESDRHRLGIGVEQQSGIGAWLNPLNYFGGTHQETAEPSLSDLWIDFLLRESEGSRNISLSESSALNTPARNTHDLVKPPPAGSFVYKNINKPVEGFDSNDLDSLLATAEKNGKEEDAVESKPESDS